MTDFYCPAFYCEIYTIRCVATNYVYVGCTKKFSQRIASHISALRHQRHRNENLQADFDLWGERAFKIKKLFSSSITQYPEAKAIARLGRLAPLYNKKIPTNLIKRRNF